MEKKFLQAEDMIADEGFQCWYFRTDERMAAEWERWLAANPGQEKLAAEAREYMDNLAVAETDIADESVEAAAQRMLAALREQQAPVVRMRRRRWWWVAAAVILLAAAGITLWPVGKEKNSMHTAYGQISEHQLPDGSLVMLNANSELTYKKENWEKGTEREVWLTGEAFFHVTKKPSKTRFVVHTDQFDVIVTGTQFNVVSRDNKTNVLLTEGSVILQTRNGQTIYMKPGDFVSFSNRQPEKKTAIEANVLAWREKKLHFEDTPLRDAIVLIREHYGVNISLENEAIGNETITGILPNDNLDVLLQALEATRDFTVIHKDSSIVITY